MKIIVFKDKQFLTLPQSYHLTCLKLTHQHLGWIDWTYWLGLMGAKSGLLKKTLSMYLVNLAPYDVQLWTHLAEGHV